MPVRLGMQMYCLEVDEPSRKLRFVTVLGYVYVIKNDIIQAGGVLAEVFVGIDSEIEEAVELVQMAYDIQ